MELLSQLHPTTTLHKIDIYSYKLNPVTKHKIEQQSSAGNKDKHQIWSHPHIKVSHSIPKAEKSSGKLSHYKKIYWENRKRHTKRFQPYKIGKL